MLNDLGVQRGIGRSLQCLAIGRAGQSQTGVDQLHPHDRIGKARPSPLARLRVYDYIPPRIQCERKRRTTAVVKIRS
ncbi:MAG: hypothetical protein BMS9Abin02_0565 [Anaerolineae bacterium]|nr:MAG: hypothetical protein BMS9Abin02_0565 [Anaerolineae bacterium]